MAAGTPDIIWSCSRTVSNDVVAILYGKQRFDNYEWYHLHEHDTVRVLHCFTPCTCSKIITQGNFRSFFEHTFEERRFLGVPTSVNLKIDSPVWSHPGGWLFHHPPGTSLTITVGQRLRPERHAGARIAAAGAVASLKKLSASWQLSVQLMYFPMGLGKIMWKWSAMISISISLDPKSRLWKCAAFFLLIDGKQNPTSNHRIPQDWLRNHGTPRDRIYHRASIEPVCNPFTHSNLLPWQRVVPGSLRAQVPSTWEAMTSMQILWVFDGFWFYGIATDDEDQINIQVRYCWWYINMR